MTKDEIPKDLCKGWEDEYVWKTKKLKNGKQFTYRAHVSNNQILPLFLGTIGTPLIGYFVLTTPWVLPIITGIWIWKKL